MMPVNSSRLDGGVGEFGTGERELIDAMVRWALKKVLTRLSILHKKRVR